MTSDVANRPIGLAEIERLREAGLLPGTRYLAAARAARDRAYWSVWGRRALLALGLGQFLSGVVFFFAYNWADLSENAKFGIVEGAIALTIIGALLVGPDRLVARMLLIAASVLVGVLLAVIGQTFQTGADAYELFLAWAVLILPWVIASRSAALWLVWFVILQLAVSLFADQVLMTTGFMSVGQISSLSGLVAGMALAARELAVRSGCDWLAARWTRLVLVGIALVTLFSPAAGFAVDYYESQDDAISAIVFLAALAALFVLYRRALPDYAVLVAGIGFADLFFIALGLRIINETIGIDFFDAGDFTIAAGFMLLWAGAGTGMAAHLMRRLRPAEQTA